MYQIFQPEDKVRHREGTVVMTVIGYEMKKEYTEPLSMIGGDRKYKLIPTDIVNCRWFDKETNASKNGQFNQKDLVKADD